MWNLEQIHKVLFRCNIYIEFQICFQIFDRMTGYSQLQNPRHFQKAPMVRPCLYKQLHLGTRMRRSLVCKQQQHHNDATSGVH